MLIGLNFNARCPWGVMLIASFPTQLKLIKELNLRVSKPKQHEFTNNFNMRTLLHGALITLANYWHSHPSIKLRLVCNVHTEANCVTMQQYIILDWPLKVCLYLQTIRCMHNWKSVVIVVGTFFSCQCNRILVGKTTFDFRFVYLIRRCKLSSSETSYSICSASWEFQNKAEL